MEKTSYHTSITVPITKAEAFERISNISAWWAKTVEGQAKKLNDVFTVRFGETWATMKVTILIPAKKINWKVEDCYLDLLKDKSEWKNNDLIFEIENEGAQTKISMTHQGLVPALECFNDCSKGWDFFIKESLFNYLTQNTGKPGTGIHARITRGERVYTGILYAKSQPLPETAEDCLIVDVAANNFEEVTEAYSIHKLDKGNFNLGQLKGGHYMLIDGKSTVDGTSTLKDLAFIIKTTQE